MTTTASATLYQKTYAEVRDALLTRAREQRNPMAFVPVERARAVFDRLDGLDRDRWAAAFGAAAEPHRAAAIAAEHAGDSAVAQREYLAAFGLFRVGRYPAPNSPQKQIAYRRSQDMLLAAARFMQPALERVEMPYVGSQAPDATIVGYLHKPAGREPAPIVVQWGGIDSYKEDCRPEPYLAAGFAVLAIDMPGVGDAPIAGSEHAEELWNGVFDWIAEQPGLDERRIAVVGLSTGGYWATKVAHTHRDRIVAAVNHGGPAHLAFQSDWIVQAARGEYPFELAETLASAFGRTTGAQWLEFAPRLSLLDQGVLEQRSAPLLCVNGIDDSIFPIEDMYLLMRHGSAKTARFTSGGHMGQHSELSRVITAFLGREVAR